MVHVNLKVGEPVYIHYSAYLSEIRMQKRGEVFSDYLAKFEQEQESNNEE